MAEAAIAAGGNAVHHERHIGPATGDRVRECQMPESNGMLVTENGDLHDSRECLHATLRFLFRPEGQDGNRATG